MERGRQLSHLGLTVPAEAEATAPGPTGPQGDWGPALPSSVETALPGQLAFTVRQLAQLLGTTPKSIYHRSERGQLPGPFRIGRTLMFRRSDLVRFMAEGRGLSPTRSRR
jgi:predicted DNA-binding transcriptional regulator AlpA